MRINLAPEMTQEVSLAAFAPAIIAIVIAGAVGYYIPMWYADKLTKEAEEVESKTAELKQQLSALEADLNKAKALQEKIGDINSRKQAISSIAEGRAHIVAVLEKIQDIHLEKMWFTKLRFEGRQIALGGWAANYDLISEYAGRIKATTGQRTSDTFNPKEFIPQFTDVPPPEKPRDLSLLKKSESKVAFSELEFKGAQTQLSPDAAKMPIQQFDIVFNTNVDVK